MKTTAVLLYVYIMVHFAETKITYNKPFAQKIKEDVIRYSGYDPLLRPVMNESSNIQVRINPALYTITDVNFGKQTMTIKVWIRMNWIDELLKWDPKDYGNVSSIMPDKASIWTPDIYTFLISNCSSILLEEVRFFLDDYALVVILQHDGTVDMAVDQVATVHCNFDVSNFPYDTQTCNFSLSSWMYSSAQLSPYPRYLTDLDTYKNHTEWNLISFTAYCTNTNNMSFVGDQYVDVWYSVVIARKPHYYLWAFVLPTFIITCLSIIGTFSPFNADGGREEKIGIGLTTLLSMVVILIMVTDQTPKSSTFLPLLGKYMMAEMCLSALATVTALGVMYLHSTWLTGRSVPRWLRGLVCSSGENPYENRSRKVSQASQTNGPAHVEGNWRDNWREIRDERRHSSSRMRKGEFNERLYHEWGRIAFRVDLFLMALFLTLNIAIVVTIICYGNAEYDGRQFPFGQKRNDSDDSPEMDWEHCQHDRARLNPT